MNRHVNAICGRLSLRHSQRDSLAILDRVCDILPQKNDRGHYAIPSLGVELGIWQGKVDNQTLPWLRWWDSDGNLLLTGEERADVEKQRADVEEQRADVEAQRADRLAAKLREMGVDPQDI